MQFFRLTLGVCSFGFIVALAACSEGDQGTGRLTQMRCAQEGLCVQKVGQRSLEIGYREADSEVRADAIYRRHGALVGSNRPFSTRFIDQDGQVFSYGNSGSNPDGWQTKDNFFGEDLSRTDAEILAFWDRKEQLLRGMLNTMQVQGRPEDVDGEAWKEIEEQLAEQLSNYTLPAKDTDRSQSPLVQENESKGVFSSKYIKDEPSGDDESADVFEHEELDEAAQEEIEAHQDAEIGGSDDVSFLEKVENTVVHKKSYFGSFSGLKKKNIDYVFHHENPRLEYKQEMDLWNLNTKTFFVLGWPSKKHHSSAEITLFARLIGTNDPWKKLGTAKTRNHGSKPGDKNMHLYAQCRDFPITRGYYNIGGECDGVWLTGHLCNDDTAYQVWHAYGGWNGGRHCVGKKRTKRPSCDKPW